MPSTAASQTIFFIAAMVVSAGVAGAFTAVIVNQLGSAIDARGTTLENQLQTSIRIINDPNSMPYDAATGKITFYVKNIGTRTIRQNTSLIEVYLNATVYRAGMLRVSALPWGSSQDWFPQSTVAVNLTAAPKLWLNHDISARIIVEYGAADTLRFRLT